MRIPLFLLHATAFVLCMLLEGKSAFAVSAVAMIVSLGLNLYRPPSFLRLIMFWQLGFLFMVCREGILFAESISQAIGDQLYSAAAVYLCAANSAVLLGWTVAFDSHRKIDGRPGGSGYNMQARIAPTALVVAAYLFAVAVLGPKALAAADEGRSAALIGQSLSIADRLLPAFAETAAMAIPPLIAFVLIHFYPRVRGKAPVTLLLSLPIFLIQALIGSRFPLLFSFAGMTVVLLSTQVFSIRLLSKLCVAGLVLFVAASVIGAIRDRGLRGSSEVIGAYFDSNPVMHSEGVVQLTGQIIDHYEGNPYLLGRSSASVLVFWVPRALWPEKPTLLGYWFIREYKPNTYFNPLHSASASFAGDAYVDFGFAGGLVLLFLVGLGFGRLDRWTASVVATRGHPMLPFVATLYPATFFAVRSLNTALITLCGVSVVVFAFMITIRRRHGSYGIPAQPSWSVSRLSVSEE